MLLNDGEPESMLVLDDELFRALVSRPNEPLMFLVYIIVKDDVIFTAVGWPNGKELTS